MNTTRTHAIRPIAILLCLLCLLAPLKAIEHTEMGISEGEKSEMSEKSKRANVYGHISLLDSGEDLPLVNVIIKHTSLGAISDHLGRYELSNLPEGKHTLLVQGLGYKPSEQTILLRAGESQEMNFVLELDKLHLEEVVVSANRTTQKRAESPVIVNTLSSELLSNTQSNVLGEGLNFCTGLRYENNCQNCGFSQVRMNGMEGAYSQILINSRPIFSGLAGVYGLELIPANMLERIEVVRGGASVLYGSNAIAGTVNLILKDPKVNAFEAGTTTSFIGVGDGSNGPVPDYGVQLNASLVTDDYQTGMAIYGNMRDRGLYDANKDGFSELAPMKNTVIGARVFHRPGNRGKLAIDFFNIREEREGGNKQDYPLHQRDVAEAVRHDLKTAALTYKQYFRDSDELSLFASGQHLLRNSYYGAGQSFSDYGRTKDLTYHLGSQYKWSLEEASVVAGLEYTSASLKDIKLAYPDLEHAIIGPNYSNTGDSIYSIPQVDNRVVSDQRLSTAGAFVQYEVKLKQFRFMAGTRVDRYEVIDRQVNSHKTGLVFIPRMNVMYDFNDYLQYRLGYSRGYRAPQIFDEDLHIETSNSRKVIHQNDPNLKQENSSSYTFSIDFNKPLAGRPSSILLEAFYTQLHNPFRNVIGEPDEDGTVIYTRTNSTDAARVSGINLESKMQVSKRLFLNAGFTIQSSEYQTGDDIFGEKKFFRTPDYYGFAAMDWEFARQWSLSATGNYTGSMLLPYFGPSLANPEAGELRSSNDFFDLGLKLQYRMKLGDSATLEYFAGVKNLFNSYQSDFDLGADRDPTYIYGPSLPRTFTLGIKIANIL